MTMKDAEERAAGQCVGALLRTEIARRATKYLSPQLTVKATRQRPIDRRTRQETFLVTVGRPNAREQQFIRVCKQAKQPFPVPGPQFAYWPKKRA